jgi:hypothetical protein
MVLVSGMLGPRVEAMGHDERHLENRPDNNKQYGTTTTADLRPPRVKRHHVWALTRPAGTTTSSTTWPGRTRRGRRGRLRRLLRRPRPVGRTTRPQGRRTVAPTSTRVLPSLPAVHGGSDRDRLRYGTTPWLHGRIGCGHRRDDAADPRADPLRAEPPGTGNAFQLTNFLRDAPRTSTEGVLPQEDPSVRRRPARRTVDQPAPGDGSRSTGLRAIARPTGAASAPDFGPPHPGRPHRCAEIRSPRRRKTRPRTGHGADAAQGHPALMMPALQTPPRLVVAGCLGTCSRGGCAPRRPRPPRGWPDR